jgi:hypothetical protein
LTSQGERAVADLSARYGVSAGAVRVMLEAVRAGNGTMAQFSHPEFGGRGQWMAGGMTMVGDMFNHGLQAKVSGLAGELSALLASAPVYAPDPAAAGGPGPADPGSWWPRELGRPASSGSQGDSRYAVFPQARRLAVQSGGGPVRVHDTLDHVIGGVQQQQGGGLPGPLSFTSQHGTFTVASLPLASPAPASPAAPGPAPAAPPGRAAPAGTGPGAVLEALERLGDLHRRGVLTDEEFAAKKADLLSRL